MNPAQFSVAPQCGAPREPLDTLRPLHEVTEHSVSEHAALDLSVAIAAGARVVSSHAQAVAHRYTRLFGFAAAADKAGELREKQRDGEIAMVFLDTWGDTTYPPKRWHDWAWAETDYAPEFLSADDLGCDPDECVTVLDFGLCFDPEPPPGYRLAHRHCAGERECPWCGPGTGNEADRADCNLCEGDGLLYWGEECQVCVFAPLASYADFEGFAEGLAALSDEASDWNEES